MHSQLKEVFMKAAIFDLDGTILNSMGMWRRLEQNFLTGLGIEPSDWIFRRMDTLGLQPLCHRTVSELSRLADRGISSR